MALHTHAVVTARTDAGADEMLAVAVVDVAREASTDATGELVTRSHFDTVLAQLEYSPGYGRLEISPQRPVLSRPRFRKRRQLTEVLRCSIRSPSPDS